MNLTPDQMTLALAAFAAVAFGTLSVFLLWEWAAEWRRQRVVRSRLADEERRIAERQSSGAGILKARLQEPADVWERLAAQLPHGDRLAVFLEQGRVRWTPGMFLLLTGGLGLAFGLVGWTLRGSFVAVVIGGAIGASLPYFWVARRRAARLRRFEEEFAGAVDLLARATRAGHPLSAGLGMVGREGPDVVGEEFLRLSEEHRYGMPLEDALTGLEDRVDLMDVHIFSTAVLIQKEVGGNLAEILDNIGETIRARFTIRRQLRVYTAQGRLTGYVLGLLPIVVAVALFLLDPEYASMLWEHPLGRFLMAAAVIMQILGYLWIRKIVDIDI